MLLSMWYQREEALNVKLPVVIGLITLIIY